MILISFTVHAQQTRQYALRHFSILNGLASNTVNDVIQDKDGYIWMATANGLQRYDGNSFLTFKSHEGNPSSIPSTDINMLFRDSRDRLWLFGGNNRIGLFDTKKFVYHKASMPAQDSTYYITQHFIQTDNGEVLMLRSNGDLFRYVEKKNEFILFNSMFPLPKSWKPNEITWDSVRKRYWISCDSGLLQYDPVTKHANYRGHNIDGDPVIASFANNILTYGVKLDGNGNVFFNNWSKPYPFPTIFRYVTKYGRRDSLDLSKHVNVYHEIWGYLNQRNGRTWVYGLPFFIEWRDKDFIPIPNDFVVEQGRKFGVVIKAFEDRESNIWMATDNGVYLFNPDAQIFNTYNIIRPGMGILEAPVTSIVELPDKRIFVGAWGMGLFYFDSSFDPLPLPSALRKEGTSMSIWDMALHSRTGQLWITQQAGRLSIYDPKTNKLLDMNPEVFGGSTIRQIDEDTSGNMWFGTQSGKVVKCDFKKSGNDPTKGYELVYQTVRVLKIHYDYQGYIYVATMGKGVIKINAKTNKVVRTFTSTGQPGERLFMDSPSDMTYYNDSTLVICAGALNILNTKTNKITYITDEDGLPSNTAVCVQRDRNGIIWVGMNNGICRLNISKKIISYYDRRDGIAYDKFQSAGVEQLKDKRVVLFTDHNLLIFSPDDFIQQNIPPKPFITSFKLAGAPLSVDSLLGSGKVELSYNNTSFSINFSALSYLQQRKLHYYYMLENMDKEWIHTDRPIEATYNYLPPGEYVFKVKSENADGVTSQELASIPIIVHPPFWNAWWFYSVIILLIISILYVIDKERMNKVRSLQMMRRQIVGNLHGEISTTLNNINVLSEIAKIKADKNVDQAKDFIDQISGKSRHMIDAMEDMLWSIDPQNDNMRKTLLRMKEVTDGLSNSNNIDIDFIVDHNVQKLVLDMKVRHEIFFFYKEAITFIVNNVSCHQIFVNINGVKSRLMIEIVSECGQETPDFRKRFETTIRKRVESLNASLDIIADMKSFSFALYVKV